MKTKKSKRAPRFEMSSTVHLQTNFYRDQFKKLSFICLFVFITSIICLLVTVLFLLYSPKDIYFPSDYRPNKSSSPAISQFSITPLIPTHQVNMSEPELLQWLMDAVIHSFSYDSQLYPQQTAEYRTYYSKVGWREYQRILLKMIDFNTLTNSQNLISTIVPLGAPTINRQGNNDGVYEWLFEVPVRVRFAGTLEVAGQEMVLQIILSRIPMDTNIDGILITSMSAINIKKQRVVIS
jgi:hypothetical protein